MLYTLIGNGCLANEREVISSLESLKSAVADGDEFWMAFLDSTDDTLSPLVGKIVDWVKASGIYYEVVVAEGTEPSILLKGADEVHVARRTLDFTVKLTKSRVQPGEPSAILVLSDDLDHDAPALYAIDRAITEGIPVYDLGGQMVQVLLEEAEPVPETITITTEEADAAYVPPPEVPLGAQRALGLIPDPEAEMVAQKDERSQELGLTEVVPSPVMVPHPVEETSNGALGEDPAASMVPESHPLATPSAEDFVLPDSNGDTPHEVAPVVSAPLVLTRPMLEDLTRDELKHLVRTYGATPKDMREKESMIVALLAKQDGDAAREPIEALAEAYGTGVLDRNKMPGPAAEPQTVMGIPGVAEAVDKMTELEQEYADLAASNAAEADYPEGYGELAPVRTPMHYYVRIHPGGAATMTPIPQEAVEPLLTLLEQV